MKKFSSLCLAAMMGASALAANVVEPTVTIFDGQFAYGGFMPQCLSANGRYVCGSTYSQVGFISEWQAQKSLICNGQGGAPRASSFVYITDEGKALGGSLIDFNTGKSQFLGLGAYVDMMTEDGSILVGMTPNKRLSEFGSPHNIEYDACYWENGRLHKLPIPTEEELGYYYLRTRARCISSDGSVILGEIIDRLYTLPMILWRRQDDGSYELDAVCKEYFSDIKYNEGYYKEYVTFQGCALSKNGRWVAMVVRDAPEYNQPAQAPYRLALYDVESGELSKAEMPEEFLSAWNPQCSVYYNGISDDGTIVGYYKNSRGGESAFIMRRSDMTLVNFIDAFPTVGLFADSEDEGLNRVSAITPDGRYICGYGSSNFDYTGYVLDRGLTDAEADEADAAGEAAVGILPANSAEAEITGYFDLSGRRLPRPAKGVNIVRRSDGSASKLIIP